MPAPRATGATDAVSAEVSGPRMRLSPLVIAAWAAVAAPAGGAAGVQDIQATGPRSSCRGKLGGLQQDLADVRARTGQGQQDR